MGPAPAGKTGNRGVLASADIFLFEEFRLDRHGDGLSRRDEHGVFVPISIGLRPLDVLVVLVERSGKLVTKEEIMAAVWGRTVVEHANLTVQIAALRRVLDEARSEKESCIQTVAGRGYRFVATVIRVEQGIGSIAIPLSGSSDVGGSATTVNPEHEARILTTADPLGVRAPPVTSRRFALAGIISAVALAILVAAATWWTHKAPLSPTAPVTAMASAPPPASAPRLSIVVLPFADLSASGGQQFLADGVTDDLTTDLSRLDGMFVISRNTAFTYKGKPTSAKQIGRELGVRYVLEGSVRRSGNQVRVNSQLIDAATGAHLWADRFEGGTADLFVLLSAITSQIAIELNLELVAAETARAIDNPDALDYILRGRAALFKTTTRESYAAAIDMFEHAVALDPRSADAQAWLARALVDRALDFQPWSQYGDLEYAEALITQALASSPRSAIAHYAKGQFLRELGRCEAAIPEYEAVLALNRNWVNAIANIGRCKMFIGPIEEAIPAQQEAMRLSPRDPGMPFWYYRIGQAHLLQSHIGDAIEWLERARGANPVLHYVHGSLAAAYALQGETERAGAALAEARRLSERPFYSSLVNARKFYTVTPNMRPLYEENYIAGLRLAGLPGE
jgi:adenylate cyclase